ncbi:MAG: DUF4430 domain-containing protein [Coprococcus sp.]
MKFFKNNWKKITGILVVIAVLVFAYWYGGNAPGTKGFSPEEKSDTASVEAEGKEDSPVKEKSDISEQKSDNNADTEKSGNDTSADNSNNDTSDTSDEQLTVADNSNQYSGITSSGQNTDITEATDEENSGRSEASGKADDENENVPGDNSSSDDKQDDSQGSRPDNDETDTTGAESDTTGTEEQQNVDDKPNDNTSRDNTEDGKPSSDMGSESSTEKPSSLPKCTISISCKTILNNMELLDKSKKSIVPKDGWILKKVTVEFNSGDTVFDVLERVTKKYGIQLEYSYTPLYGSYYIEGMYNLYEFDCGHLSGWMYSVNGSFPNFGCSKYVLKDGDVIEWVYTCDLGEDVGNPY